MAEAAGHPRGWQLVEAPSSAGALPACCSNFHCCHRKRSGCDEQRLRSTGFYLLCVCVCARARARVFQGCTRSKHIPFKWTRPLLQLRLDGPYGGANLIRANQLVCRTGDGCACVWAVGRCRLGWGWVGVGWVREGGRRGAALCSTDGSVPGVHQVHTRATTPPCCCCHRQAFVANVGKEAPAPAGSAMGPSHTSS